MVWWEREEKRVGDRALPVGAAAAPAPRPLRAACACRLASLRHPCNIHATSMQHSCNIHAASMQHPCNIHAMALAAVRDIPGFRARPPERFSQRRGVSGCEACGGHVARRRGQHGMTCGQRGAREPRRRLNRQHARARGSFFSCEHREEQVIYTTVLPALQSCRAVIEGCERFAIFKRRARVRIPTRSVSKCDCCAAAAACSLQPHASRLTQIQLTAAGFCAPQLLFARAGISLGSAVICWSSFVAPHVAFSCSISISSWRL